MSSSIPSRSSPESEVLQFSKELDKISGNAAKVLRVVELILTKEPLEFLQLEEDLALKVTELRQMLDSPTLSGRVNVFATKALKSEMEQIVELKVLELKSRIAQKKLCRDILTEIPPHRISSFVDTVEGFYHQALQEGKAPQEALIFALSKGMLRSMVELPNSDEIEADQELQAKIEADPDLQPYKCVITGSLVGSDAVYLKQRVDGNGNPRERYHEKDLTDWIGEKLTDPVTREARTLADIKPDLKGREFVEKKLCALIYPELTPKQTGASAAIEALHSKALLLALAAAYPVIQEKHEGSAEKIINRFALIVEGMNWEGEEVVFPCFPAIKEFLREAEKKLTDGNLEEVRADLIGKLGIFITFFHEMEFSQPQLSLRSQAKALKMAGEAISSGASLDEVMELFTQYVGSIKEEAEIRKTFPGCLIGKSEWDTYLGTVEEVPVPPGMLDILNQDSPITPGKKVGETHTLVFIPSTINGQPLTLNSLGALVRSKGHFPDTEAGYGYMSPDVAAQNGNAQIGRSHWALMTKDMLPGSRNKSYAEQQAMVATLASTSGASYEVPGVLDATACIFMNYLTSPQDERLFLFSRNSWTYTRCQEQIQGCPVVVGSFVSVGLRVRSFGYGRDKNGVAALRRFWP